MEEMGMLFAGINVIGEKRRAKLRAKTRVTKERLRFVPKESDILKEVVVEEAWWTTKATTTFNQDSNEDICGQIAKLKNSKANENLKERKIKS